MDLETLTQFGFSKALGLRYDHLGPDRVELSLTITPAHHQGYGIVHGGVWCAAIETAASIGADLWWGDRGRIVGVANNTDLIRAAREGEVTVVATPLHQGRLQQIWVVEVHDEQERLLARGQVRIQNLEDSDQLGR